MNIKGQAESQSSMIIGSREGSTMRDKALSINISRNSSQVMKTMRDFRSAIDCLPGAQTCRNSDKKVVSNKENFSPGIKQTATTFEKEQFGQMIREKVKQAKTYDRSMQLLEPETFINRTYQNQAVKQKDKAYEKGTKKFWEKTQELYSSKNKVEKELIGIEMQKGRKPYGVHDAFKS